MNLIRLFLISLIFSAPAFAQDFCYGSISEGGACVPASVETQRANTIAAPGDLFALADESRLTMTVILPEGVEFAGTPSVTAGTIVGFSESSLSAVGDGPFAVSGLTLSGDFQLASEVIADVRVFNPNTASAVFAGPVVLARIVGAFNKTILTLNPGSNSEQQTFLRLVNLDLSEATVVLTPTDDAGVEGGSATVTLAPRAAVQLTSFDLERGAPEKGLDGAFGDGTGKWWVRATSDQNVSVQALSRGGLGAIQP